jgi:hypothetical protein
MLAKLETESAGAGELELESSGGRGFAALYAAAPIASPRRNVSNEARKVLASHVFVVIVGVSVDKLPRSGGARQTIVYPGNPIRKVRNRNLGSDATRARGIPHSASSKRRTRGAEQRNM